LHADNQQNQQQPDRPAAAGGAGGPTILVADDMSIVREPIAASLRAAGYDVACAADGKEALALIQSRRPKLILLDLNMPFLDGLAVMRAMNSLGPEFHAIVMLLTSDSDRERILEAAKLGAKEYLLKKSFSFGRLIERVAKYLPASPSSPPAAANPAAGTMTQTGPSPAANAQATAGGQAPQAPAGTTSGGQSSTFKKLLDRESCVARVETALKGKTFQGVVMEVISLAASSRGDLTQVANVVSRDPMLAARVLQVANSSAYSTGRGSVSTIPAAVKQIGYAALRNTAAALAVFSTMPAAATLGRAPLPSGSFNPVRCWQHSFAVAQLCERLMRPVDESAAGTAYVVGLCHDLAEILFQTEFAPEYAQVIKAHADSGIPIDYLEREMMGVTRDSIIRTILHKLGLPENIAGPIESYHQWERGGQAPGDRMTRILRLADRYAIGLLLAPSNHAPVGPLSAADCRAAVGIDSPNRPDDVQFRNDVLALTTAIARLTPAEQASLTRPMFQPLPVKVWLARDPMFSAFDPLATALNSMAQVDVFSELPTQSQDWSGYGAVVVVARSTAAPGFDPTRLPKPSGPQTIGGIPVLWAVAKNEAIATSSRMLATVTLPLALDDLARFLRSAAESTTARPEKIPA
jgi:CheY-like chemotaxis protein/HD-like signal output (HDOD) protein